MKWIAALALCACGRIGYDPVVPQDTGGSGGGDGDGDDALASCLERPGVIFCDGFEDPALSPWMLDTAGGAGATAVRSTTTFRTGVAGLETRIASTGQSANAEASIWGTTTSGDIYVRAWFLVADFVDSANLLETSSVAPGIAAYARADQLRVWNDVIGSGTSSTTNVPRGAWFCLEFHVVLGDVSGTYELFFNDQVVLQSNAQDTLPAGGVTGIAVGIPHTAAQQAALAVAVDDVISGTQRIGCQ